VQVVLHNGHKMTIVVDVVAVVVKLCSLYSSLQRGRSTWQYIEERRRPQVCLQQPAAHLSAKTLPTTARHLRKHRILM